MLNCPNPTCKKRLERLHPQCPHCRTDLGLLLDYVDNLQVGLDRAEELTRAGQLGEAVWAYLEVLEVDPDNEIARRQVGRVVTAVRMFDRAAPGQRWLSRLRRQARFRRSIRFWEGDGEEDRGWLGVVGMLLVAVAAMLTGYWLGYQEAQPRPTDETVEETDKGLGTDKAKSKELPAGKIRAPQEPAKKSQSQDEPAGKVRS
jgi:hypothetical protein